MKKVSQEYKNEVDKEFSEADYIGRKIGFRVLIIALVAIIIVSIGGAAYKKWSTNTGREIFKNSAAYTESAANFLAKSYMEYNTTDDDADKKAIMNYVIQRYPNLDIKTIDNIDLRNFYRDCMKGN